ncbi:uncharacterized protein LOC116848170 isoform X2 [Odontomachus brunneus]|nr:uncharacterized protein LOC116848170 isoform X2 [Odontomachus brunneus]XP_032679887.1 uncharacterized protein LOC116848170 isoform X2 [Odontomachus brunneus]XP_032679888.1 uncharacterized protein LOC116848170 isoform X2 [Odontomachus brunneus]XP_032679889.1 uncharacterized protein LOC116848170 isoform X2 [Odontomachus brunneus]
MASREKKPLAPSKLKQKASSDSGLPSNEVKNKKGKSLPSIKQQQLAREIFDTVATGNQLSAKLEASLPRKKALKTLKRKQNLRVAKANLIKSKVTKKVTNKNIRGIPSNVKKAVKARRVKQCEESTVRSIGIALRLSESQTNSGDNEGKGTETPSKSAKNNLRTKKTKSTSSRSVGESGNEDVQDTEEASVAASTKSSPKLGKKKAIESTDSLSKSAKTAKSASLKKNSIKDIVVKVTEQSDSKGAKGKKSTGKESDCGNSVKSNTSIEKVTKVVLDNKSSIDLTIDAVIASMLSDSETDSQQSVTEKIEGKITRSRKMLVDENIAADVEVKKEPDTEDTKVTSDGECTEADQGLHLQNAIQLRKRSSKLPSLNHPIDQVFQSSLRNGKQRHLSDSGNSTSDLDPRRRRLNSDGPPVSDNSIEHISECGVNMDSCLSDPSCNESQTTVASTKEDVCSTKDDDVSKNFDENAETASEIENNNNSDRMDRTGEIGPTLRSKTKTKSTENEATKDDNAKAEDTWVSSKCVDAQDDSKKLNNLDQARKDSILAKLGDKPKGRRNSLNIDMKKTVNSFYNADKSDTAPKAPIDKIIEGIKLTIVKSIEDKIYRPGLSKNFDMPKSEEVIAPLSTESQKLGLEENTDEDKSIVTENESTSESSENSVPKVADTAKEIEKLVMFDIEEAETHSQNTQENKASGSDRIHDVHNTCESTCNISSNSGTSCNNVNESEAGSVGCSTANDTSTNISDNDSKLSDENKKAVTITRKSPRISDKSSDSAGNSETRKSNRTPNKVASKLDNADVDTQKPSNEDIVACDSPKEDTVSHQHSDDNAVSSPIPASSEQTEESLPEEHSQTRSTEESETEISLNVSGDSEESETLESISREVERLVAGDQVVRSPSSPANDATQSEEVTLDVKDEEHEVPNKHEASACRDDNFTTSGSAADVANETSSKNRADGKPVDATETLKENDAPDETAQDVKHHKTSNNPSSTTTNCDSNSECSSVNPVPTHTCTSGRREADETEEGGKPDQDSSNCKEASKPNNNSVANCDTTRNTDENVLNQKSGHSDTAAPIADESNKSSDEQKPVNDEKNRRVLRARDKQKKVESRQASRSLSREHIDNNVKVKTEVQNTSVDKVDVDEVQDSTLDETSVPESSQKTEDTSDSQNNNEDVDSLEPQSRTRRSRDGKRRREDPPPLTSGLKAKRTKRDLRKSDQQNKEETLLDNEVAKINENNRSFRKYGGSAGERTADSFCSYFEEGAQDGLDKLEKSSNLRSKSENDLTIAVDEAGKNEERLSRNLSENHVSKRDDDVDLLANACKTLKTPEANAQKDFDEASTSGESSNSGTPKILETPEDKAKKESILRVLGLESLEKAAERLNHQKARKEQYTGTLKTIIRVQKEKDKDKRGSRSPLKMVLKQQGRGDGEGDSPEFYTIQKEFGTSGLGDSSSGANRKFTTNHRHSCDEDNEEATPKDRQSLVIPEKSSSFSIHPERLCADVCCYCFGKFGSLDTPMHLAQMKSDERRKKILNIERHLTKDSCLCDACYRHVDRKANTSPTNMQQKPPKQHRQLMVLKCSARECRDPARHNVKRRWLLKIKLGLQNQVDIDWESSQHTSMSFCVNHYGKIERFLTCALCKRRLVRNHTHQLANAEIDELNQLVAQQGIPVILAAGTFVCKLCRYFTQLHLKYKDVDNMNTNSRSFFKSYRKRILHYHDIEVPEFEDDDTVQSQTKDKDKRKKSAKGAQSKNSKSPDRTINSTSEKSIPELSKGEGGANEMDTENRTGAKASVSDETVTEAQYFGLDRAVENLKKRKLLDLHTSYTTTESPVSSCGDVSNDVEEILAMDKEVTLTRLPKRARANNNDIAPVVQRLGANPSISVRTLFPGEEEMNLHAKIEFGNVREITPQGWEKCATMIQYDRDTKLLWQELQRPYGNQSSFLRHLILLEKYYRSGDLILAPNASRNAINYSTSVQNRLISYEGPEKMDEPIMEPIGVPSEYTNSRRLSGGYMMEKDNRLPSLPSTSSSSMKPSTSSSLHPTAKASSSPPRMLKLNTGVSIIKKPPPNLQRFSSLPSTSTANGGVKRKEAQRPSSAVLGGKMFHYSEADIKRLQTMKRQKQFNERPPSGPMVSVSSSPPGLKAVSQYQKAQLVQHNQQFQQHLRMQQEMLNRQSRGDFEPLICDMRSSGTANENSSTHNLIQNLNLPKSIQVTTKPSNPIPILPKIPKSLTVIPQTVTRPVDK